jgi:hypothetical protein
MQSPRVKVATNRLARTRPHARDRDRVRVGHSQQHVRVPGLSPCPGRRLFRPMFRWGESMSVSTHESLQTIGDFATSRSTSQRLSARRSRSGEGHPGDRSLSARAGRGGASPTPSGTYRRRNAVTDVGKERANDLSEGPTRRCLTIARSRAAVEKIPGACYVPAVPAINDPIMRRSAPARLGRCLVRDARRGASGTVTALSASLSKRNEPGPRSTPCETTG